MQYDRLMSNSTKQQTAFKYNDFWFKILGSLIASGLIDSLNRKGAILDRMVEKTFLIDLIAGFLISLLLWEFVRYVTRKLDERFDWLAKPAQRIGLQFAFCVCMPAALSFVFTLCFMQIAYQQDIFNTTWLYSEFYAVILIILLINLVYFTWWLFLKNETDTPTPSRQPILHKQDIIPQPIQVSKGNANVLLHHAEIAFINLDGNYSFIYTHDGENFVTTYTLDDLSKRLGEDSFFRANRQVIISRKSCRAFKSIENGKITIDIVPVPKIPVIISQKRASDFRKWIVGNKIPESLDILQG